MEGLALSVGVAGAMILLRFIGDWIIFLKAGKPGWHSIIPREQETGKIVRKRIIVRPVPVFLRGPRQDHSGSRQLAISGKNRLILLKRFH